MKQGTEAMADPLDPAFGGHSLSRLEKVRGFNYYSLLLVIFCNVPPGSCDEVSEASNMGEGRYAALK
jgi:hypothetical protein